MQDRLDVAATRDKESKPPLPARCGKSPLCKGSNTVEAHAVEQVCILTCGCFQK